MLARTLGDLGDGAGAAAAEHHPHHDRPAPLELVDRDPVDLGDREREERAQLERREGLAGRQGQRHSRTDARRGGGPADGGTRPGQGADVHPLQIADHLGRCGLRVPLAGPGDVIAHQRALQLDRLVEEVEDPLPRTGSVDGTFCHALYSLGRHVPAESPTRTVELTLL
ncbi:hypothetical protein GCM10010441_36280 [Kitasatospora paracochleata]